ncbi:MAG: 5'-methylthioadenosine/adenosylhomocysteine nucleosidase [Gammaproteobacteria bacterium]|nr:5'-methylthioadenosine/adenosylhomocysteine nucleosidase [Gammaproteobacteria bacterium]MBV8402806.1 5'-methylthioadenosine/adenosylhomocysteine nucleosidase [Gammaproteobacteria bacterium]
MPDEITAVVESLGKVSTQTLGRRQYQVGSFRGEQLVAVFSGWGKVAAAATATQLITTFGATRMVFTGVAGAVQDGLAIGDVVIGTELIQHDMDASPIFPRYEVPLLGRALLGTDSGLRARLRAAAEGFLREDLRRSVSQSSRDWFHIESPRVIEGVIASGDQFIDSAAEIAALRHSLPQVTCVEMEGAAVAQVCEEYAVPFGVVRTISDAADESAPHDFARFAREVAGQYSFGILSHFLRER